MSRLVAITGATGFVGAETLSQLLGAGFRIRALARRPQTGRDGVEWVAGALDDAAALDRLVAGADIVLHIAGVVNAPSRAGFKAGNVTGTANVIAAMQGAGVTRLVHVSSLAAREKELADYCWSKALAEDHVRASGLEWTMVRPPAVYGPGDTEFRELFHAARAGIFPVPPGGRASLIHVEDLARLLVLLCSPEGDAHRGATWEVSDGTPDGLSHPELAAAFGTALGRKVRALPLPQWVLMSFAAMDCLARGPAAKLTPDRVRYMCHRDWVAEPSKAPPESFWKSRIGSVEGLGRAAQAYLASRS